MSALYLWNAQIAPDQPWAMRRYVPVVLPLLLVLAAAFGLRELWRVRRPVALVLRPLVRRVPSCYGAGVHRRRHPCRCGTCARRTRSSPSCRRCARRSAADGAVLDARR